MEINIDITELQVLANNTLFDTLRLATFLLK